MDTIWQDAVTAVSPYVVKISTPQGTGTGFLVWRSKNGQMCGIATAAHVIDHAHHWEQPIRIRHHTSGASALLRLDDRAIFLDEKRDAAIILVGNEALPLPAEVPILWPNRKYLKIGNEAGWLGFPAVAPDNHLCFFSGRVSCFLEDAEAYLIDGLAINGVSGGPTFFPVEGNPIIGIVTAYIPNRATGTTLPGVSVVQNVSALHEMVEGFQSFEEAKEAEPQSDAPPPPTPDSPPPAG